MQASCANQTSPKGFIMTISDKTRLLQTSILTSLVISMAGVSFAQDAATQEEEIDVIPESTQPVEDTEGSAQATGDEVVVTGSRLKRDTFSSISPLQVIDTEIAAEKGLFNPVEIPVSYTHLRAHET